MDSYDVAKRIRQFRRDKAMTQTELAAKCNVTRSLICKIEANDASIHLDLLINIAAALGMTVSDLLAEAAPPYFTIVRGNERKKLIASRLRGQGGYDYYPLGELKKEARLEMFVVVISKEAVQSTRLVSHKGFEFVYVLDGKLSLFFRNEENILSTGDSAFFDATKPHRLNPYTSDIVEVICIFLYPKMSI